MWPHRQLALPAIFVLTLFLPFMLSASFVDIRGCTAEQQLTIFQGIDSVRHLLQIAAARLSKFNRFLRQPYSVGDLKTLDTDLLSIMTMYELLIDQKFLMEYATLSPASRLQHMQTTYFLEELAQTLARNLERRSTLDRLSVLQRPIYQNRRMLQFWCGDDWLTPSTIRPGDFEDNRPSLLIATSERSPRTFIVLPGGSKSEQLPFSADNRAFRAPPALLFQGLAGPWETVIALNPTAFYNWTHGRPAIEPTYTQHLNSTFAPGSIALAANVHFHVEAALIWAFAQSNELALNDIDYDSTRGGIRAQEYEGTYHSYPMVDDNSRARTTEPRSRPVQIGRCNPFLASGWRCARYLASVNPRWAVQSAANFMYLVLSLGLENADWSKGYNRDPAAVRADIDARVVADEGLSGAASRGTGSRTRGPRGRGSRGTGSRGRGTRGRGSVTSARGQPSVSDLTPSRPNKRPGADAEDLRSTESSGAGRQVGNAERKRQRVISSSSEESSASNAEYQRSYPEDVSSASAAARNAPQAQSSTYGADVSSAAGLSRSGRQSSPVAMSSESDAQQSPSDPGSPAYEADASSGSGASGSEQESPPAAGFSGYWAQENSPEPWSAGLSGHSSSLEAGSSAHDAHVSSALGPSGSEQEPPPLPRPSSESTSGDSPPSTSSGSDFHKMD